MIVIGLGSGRSGTASLAKLLSSQADSHCFHEMNPSCVRFSGTPRPILNTIEEFQAILDGGDPARLTADLSRPVTAQAYDRLCQMPSVRLIGDVAFYYLSYVEQIAELNPNVRFVCLRRGKTETVESWMRKSTINRWPSKRVADRLSAWIVREPYQESYNYWMEHDGKVWRKDAVWDKCFPKFDASSKRDAIGKYYDYYYGVSEKLQDQLPYRFRMFNMEVLNNQEKQEDLLSFCGVARAQLVLKQYHIHGTR